MTKLLTIDLRSTAPQMLGSRGTPSQLVLYGLKNMCAKFDAFTRFVTIFPLTDRTSIVSGPPEFFPGSFPGTWLFGRRPEPVVGLALPWPLPLPLCGGWRGCWRRCVGPLELVSPIRATKVKTLHKPRTGQLRVMTRRPLLLDLGLSCCLGCPFLLLSFLQLLRKLRHTFVANALLLPHLLQNGFHFKIELEPFKSIYEFFMVGIHDEMTQPGTRSVL